MNELLERLANIEHERWVGWQKYLHSRCEENEDGSLTIPYHLVERWCRQCETPYNKLSEQEKASDRKEVYKTVEELHKTHAIVENSHIPSTAIPVWTL